MTTVYTYCLINNLGGYYNGQQLTDEINANETIVTTLSYINREDTQIKIFFVSALSNEEQTALNTVVSLHVQKTNLPEYRVINISIEKTKSITSTYTKYSTFLYFEKNNEIKKLKMISYGDGASYSVKIINGNNASVIAEITNLTNTIPQIIEFPTITNVSKGESIWEIQAKQTSGVYRDITIDTINLYYL